MGTKCRPGCNSSMPTNAQIGGVGYSWWDLYNVSSFFHSLGHDVFILSMPLKGVNVGPGSTPTKVNDDHWWFLQWEQKGDHPLRYFLEPAYVDPQPCESRLCANAITSKVLDGQFRGGAGIRGDIHGWIEWQVCHDHYFYPFERPLGQLSTDATVAGGGWSTTFASAIDKRIKASFPIAGSTPCAMRNPTGLFPGQTWFVLILHPKLSTRSTGNIDGVPCPCLQDGIRSRGL